MEIHNSPSCDKAEMTGGNRLCKQLVNVGWGGGKRERTWLDCREESHGVDVGVEDGGQEPQPGWGVWIVDRELHLRLDQVGG